MYIMGIAVVVRNCAGPKEPMKVSSAAACRLSQAESVANFGPCLADSCADVVVHLYMLAF